MNPYKWLESIKVGDTVASSLGWSGDRLLMVVRLTKTLIITDDENRWVRRSGFMQGSTGYSRSRIYEATPAVVERITLKTMEAEVRSAINAQPSPALVRALHAVLKEVTK